MGGPIELHREARICTMLDSGGKSRVKRTLQPLSGSAHPAIIQARISRLGSEEWRKWGCLWIPFYNLFSRTGGWRFPGQEMRFIRVACHRRWQP